jgi:hypothetical protein
MNYRYLSNCYEFRFIIKGKEETEHSKLIKMSNPTRLETPALPLPLPARKAQNGVLTFQDYGMPKYGV